MRPPDSTDNASPPQSSGAAPAAGMLARSRHLRTRDGSRQETTTFELFFDLVYVFAVTQLSHLVIDHDLRLEAVGHAAFLLIVVWWAWLYTTWMANWFDPRSLPVRLILAGVALASMFMSAAIPGAFGADGLLFALAYVAMQCGRSTMALFLLGRHEPLRPVFARLVAWSLVTAPVWIAGGIAQPSARLPLWGAALVIDLAAPLVGYRTPGLGRSLTTDWNVEGGHFAERFQSFVIIALGESIVITGATASARGLTTPVELALVVAVVVTTALWWLYFSDVAENSLRDMTEAEDPGRLARDAYTYLHLPIVAGIITVAIADDLLIMQPSDRLSSAGVIMTVAGPALFLAGESLVRLRMIAGISPQRLSAIAALVILGVIGSGFSALALSLVVALVLVGLAVWEHERFYPRRPPFAPFRLRRAVTEDDETPERR